MVPTRELAIVPSDAETISENYEQGEMPAFLRVDFPAGKQTQFSVQRAEGVEYLPEVEGVVWYWHTARAYWPSTTPGNNPPECSSLDGVTGSKYGACAHCRHAAFGTAIGQDGGKRAGQACKDMRRLYLLRDGERVPLLLVLPPASLGAWKEYRDQLYAARHGLRQVVTKIGLSPARSRDGITYNQASFVMTGLLGPQTVAAVRSLHDGMANTARQLAPGPADYNTADSVDALDGAARPVAEGKASPALSSPPAPPPPVKAAWETLDPARAVLRRAGSVLRVTQDYTPSGTLYALVEIRTPAGNGDLLFVGDLAERAGELGQGASVEVDCYPVAMSVGTPPVGRVVRMIGVRPQEGLPF